MIRLEIVNSKGKFNLVLNHDTSIRMEHNSPLFETDVIPGSRTYRFSIPINDLNRQYLQFPEKLMFNGRVRLYTCNYYFFGRLMSSGKLAILRANTDYQAIYTFNSFAVDYKDKKLEEIIDETISYNDVVNAANQIITRTNLSDKVQYPEIYNDKFYEGAEEENTRYDLVMNRFDSDNNTFLRNYYDSGSGFNENKNTIVPQPYLMYVFSKMFENIGYEIFGEVIDDGNLKKLLIYNNYPLDQFGVLLEQGLNIFKNEFNLNQILPDILVKDFVNVIKDFLQLGVFFDNENNKILFLYKNTILDSQKYIDIDAFAPDENESIFSDDTGYEISYDFSDNSRADLVNVSVNEDEVLEFDTFEQLYPFHGQTENLFYVRNTANYFRSRESPRVSDWSRISERYFPIKKGEGVLKLNLKLGPILSYTIRGASTLGIVPIIREPGSSDVFSTGRNYPGLKLMIWHGLRADYDNDLYPCASSVNIDNDGNRIADLSLLLDGIDGVYEKYQKKWLDFQTNADKIRVIAKLPVATYFNIIDVFSAKKDAPRKLRYRGINFIPEKISAFHSNQSDMIEAELIMHKFGTIDFKLEDEFYEILEVNPSLFTSNSALKTEIVAIVTSTTQWHASSVNSWISITRGDGLNNDYLTFGISENSATTQRTGIITITNSTKSIDISIVQEGSTVQECVLVVTPTLINTTKLTTVHNVNIQTNAPWVATVVDVGTPFYTPNPITLDKYSGSGTDVIQMTVPSVPSGFVTFHRYVRITACTKEEEITIVQS